MEKHMAELWGKGRILGEVLLRQPGSGISLGVTDVNSDILPPVFRQLINTQAINYLKG